MTANKRLETTKQKDRSRRAFDRSVFTLTNMLNDAVKLDYLDKSAQRVDIGRERKSLHVWPSYSSIKFRLCERLQQLQRVLITERINAKTSFWFVIL